MARKKTVKSIAPGEIGQQASRDVAVELANAFDDFTMDKYGMLNPPSPYVTPTGIKPLDAILGGGFSSSMPIAFSSTPESGKSSIAFQFAKTFLDYHENGIVVYFDVESTAAELEVSDNITVYQESRAETFGLHDDPRFKYNRRPFTIKEFFEYLDGLIERKRDIQTKTGGEVKILFVLDSITALSYSRLDAVEDFDKFYRIKINNNFIL